MYVNNDLGNSKEKDEVRVVPLHINSYDVRSLVRSGHKLEDQKTFMYIVGPQSRTKEIDQGRPHICNRPKKFHFIHTVVVVHDDLIYCKR